MKETHEFKFAGCHLPREVVYMLSDKQLDARDILLYVIIASLEGDDGCYASNEYLAASCHIDVRSVRRHLTKLKKLGVVTQVRFDGRKRFIKTSLPNPAPPPSGGGQTCPGGGDKFVPHKKLTVRSLHCPHKSADGEEGFGFANTTKENTTEFDTKIATKLLEAARKHLGASHPNLKRAKLASWSNQIRLLRTTDEVEEARISETMNWYIRHIGEEFVSEAFSGNSFRKKFHAIERQSRRDLTNITISKEATKLAEQLAMKWWPVGSDKALPSACQACLDEYKKQVARFRRFSEEAQHTTAEVKMCDHILQILPAPLQFVREWMTETHIRVCSWDDWNGDLAPFLFKTQSKRWRAIGRGWAVGYTNDSDRWDGLCAAMKQAGI